MARAFKSVPLVRPKYGSVCRGGKAGCLFVGSHARHRFLRWAFRHAALRPAAAARVPGHPFFFTVGECSVCVLSLGAVARWAWPACWPVHPPPSTRKPHGTTAPVARVVSLRVAADLGQQMVVDNKPGAGGTIGTAEAAKAPADGYTLLLPTSSTHAISPHLMPRLAYDPRKDFTPVAHVADAPSVLLVTNSLPVKTVGELV